MKVKGYGFTSSQSAVEKSISAFNISEYIKNELLVSNSAAKKVVFDVADYIIPQNQNMQAFIMTNFDLIVQSIGSCSEYNPMSNVKHVDSLFTIHLNIKVFLLFLLPFFQDAKFKKYI